MKRCPECGREYDNSMMFCLDDGAELLYGPASGPEPPASAGGFLPHDGEPQTAILSEPPVLALGHLGDAETRAQTHATEKTAGLPQTSPQTTSRKNTLIAGALGIVVVTALGIGSYLYYGRNSTKQIESIAVMPFVNESGNPDVEYLSDGMTETLISSLSQLPNLRVKASSSVFRYKGKDTDLKTVGIDLNVKAILTGKVVQLGEQLTLNLSLVDAATETVIWSEQYVRRQTDLVGLQAEIARDVSRKLRVKLSDADEKNLAKNFSQSTEAYHLYLKGHFYWDKQTASGYKQAIEYFNKAAEMDPTYALAYSGLANTYIALGIDYAPPKDVFPIAKLYAQKALDLTPDLAEAHAAMGSINFFYEWNWSAADNELKRVIELNPEATEPYSCTLHYLDSAGRPDDAVAEVKRVAERHPTSIVINAEIGCSSYYAHRYDDAIMELHKTIGMDPGFATAYYNLGRAYGQKKMFREAVSVLTKAKELSDETPFVVAELGYAYAASGNKAAANDAMKNLDERSPARYVDPYLKAIVFIGSDDKEKTLVELEKAFQLRSSWMIWLKVEPKFEILHSDPRFQDLVRRVGLPEPSL